MPAPPSAGCGAGPRAETDRRRRGGVPASCCRPAARPGGPRLLGSYDAARARADTALQDLTLDAEGTPLAAAMRGLRASADAWRAWSAQRLAQFGAGGPPAAGGGLGEGEG